MDLNKISKRWTTKERIAVIQAIAEEMRTNPSAQQDQILSWSDRIILLLVQPASFLEANRKKILTGKDTNE